METMSSTKWKSKKTLNTILIGEKKNTPIPENISVQYSIQLHVYSLGISKHKMVI